MNSIIVSLVLLAFVAGSASATGLDGAATLAGAAAINQPLAGVLSWHGDNFNSAINATERVLTPSNVNTATFKKLYSVSVTGLTYAQPVVVRRVAIGGTTYDAVAYVATLHNEVTAFDVATGAILWGPVSLGPPAQIPSEIGCSTTGGPEVGVLSTPAIDPAAGTLYAVALTGGAGPSSVAYTAHALDLLTGSERAGWPISLTASAGGATFNPGAQNQRPGLRIANGRVFITFASWCDAPPYHAWVMAVNTSTRALTAAIMDLSTSWGAIWMGGAAPAADDAGLYVVLGNGGTAHNSWNGTNCPGAPVSNDNSVLRLDLTSLAILDAFSPWNWCVLNDADLDLGSGGPILVDFPSGPRPQRLLVSGKATFDGAAAQNPAVYMLDRTNLGGFTLFSNAGALQYFGMTGQTDFVVGAGVFFNSTYYVAPDNMLAFTYDPSTHLFTTTAAANLGGSYGEASSGAVRGGSQFVSANGTANAVLWTLETNLTNPGAILHAFDPATNTELYNSEQAGSVRDRGPAPVKFQTPVPIAGKVIVCGSAQCAVYGNF